MSDGAITLDRVVQRFGDVTAVDDISLEIAASESLVVLGPSGSGKSTLLRTIAGLEECDSGTITIGGTPQVGLPPHKRDVAIVFQHFALYPHLTALDNITLGLRHGLRLSKDESLRRARDVAARMDITALLDRRPREMSGGQRQRVALARALARKARVVLLDEPLSGLDAQLRLSLRAEIATLLRETGATSIHVTHDQNDAMAMADRIAVLNKGRIEQLGTPEDLYRRPQSMFVAGFIGSPAMNLIAGEPRANYVDSPFGTVRSRSGVTSLVFAVRPENLELGTPREWSFNAPVTAVEHEGPSKIVHLDLHGHPVRARVHPDVHVNVGTVVSAGCSGTNLHVFDGDTGRALGSADDTVTRMAADAVISA